MAIFQAIFAFIARSAGRIVSMVFGWATGMLFGKVPENRQIFLSLMALGSVLWIVAVLGIIFPSFATFMLAFVTLPEWVDKGWIRLIMLAAALVIPALVGVLSLFMLDPADRPREGAGKAKLVLHGYRYTPAVAITLLLLMVFAPVMKVRDILKHWTSEHVPVIVEDEDYREVLDDVQQALERGGLPTQREQANWMLRLPLKVLTAVGGASTDQLVADDLSVLKSETLEVLLYPSDLIISGQKMDAAQARAVLTEQMTFTKAYMTTTKEANIIEDRLRVLWEDLKAKPDGASLRGQIYELQAIERALHKLKLSHDEWSVLFRGKLLVERGLLQLRAGLTDRPRDLTERAPAESPTEEAQGKNGLPAAPLGAAAALAIGGAVGYTLAAQAKADDKATPPPDHAAGGDSAAGAL